MEARKMATAKEIEKAQKTKRNTSCEKINKYKTATQSYQLPNSRTSTQKFNRIRIVIMLTEFVVANGSN